MSISKKIDLNVEELNNTECGKLDIGSKKLGTMNFFNKVNRVPYRLEIYDNQLKDLNNCFYLPNLQYVNASSNLLISVTFVKYLKKLLWINLSCNIIDDLDGFSGHSTLQIINIACNRIITPVQLTPLKTCYALKQLILFEEFYSPHQLYQQNKITLHADYPQCVLPYLPKYIQTIDKQNNQYSLTNNDKQMLSKEQFILKKYSLKYSTANSYYDATVSDRNGDNEFYQMLLTINPEKRFNIFTTSLRALNQQLDYMCEQLKIVRTSEGEDKYMIIDNMQNEVKQMLIEISKLQSIELYMFKQIQQ